MDEQLHIITEREQEKEEEEEAQNKQIMWHIKRFMLM